MTEQTDKLRLIVEMLGADLTSAELKQVGEELQKTGAAADKATPAVRETGKEVDKAGEAAKKASPKVKALARDLAQGDWRNSALHVVSLSTSFGLLGIAAGVAAAAGAGLGVAFYQGWKEAKEFNNALILTGNYAGLVSGQLDVLSASVARSTNSTVGNARETLQAMVSSGRFSSGVMESAGRAIELVAAVSGRTRSAVVADFAKISEGVTKWAVNQNEQYHFLSLSQYEHIRALEEQGRSSEAARFTMDAMTSSMGNKVAPALGYLERLVVFGTKKWSEFWDAAKGFGRPETVVDRLNEAGEAVNKAMKNLAEAKKNNGGSSLDAALLRKAEEDLKRALAAHGNAQSAANIERDAAQRRAAAAEQAQAQIKAVQDLEKVRLSLDKNLRMEKELADFRATVRTLEGTASAVSAAEQAQREAQIKARYAERGGGGGGGAKQAEQEAQALRRLLSETQGLSASFSQEWDRLSTLYTVGVDGQRISLEKLIEKQGELLARQPAIRAEAQAQEAIAKAQAAAEKELGDIRVRANELSNRRIAGEERELAALMASNSQLEMQAQQVGLTTEQLGRLTLKRLDAAIATERMNLVNEKNKDTDAVELGLIERRIRLLERQRQLTQELGTATVADEQRKQNEADSKKFSEDLRRDVTDSLQRAFEAGKSPADALASVLANTIKTRVTRALAEAIANPILKPLEQALSGGGLGGFMNLFQGSGVELAGTYGDLPDYASGSLTRLFGMSHTGGMVGREHSGYRSANPAVFAGASRFHGGGLVSGEVPIIAKAGEGVFTAGQMKALAPVGSTSAPQVTVNVQTLPGQTADVRQRQDGGGLSIDVIMRQIEEQLADNISAGAGAVGAAMEGRYNLRTAVT